MHSLRRQRAKSSDEGTRTVAEAEGEEWVQKENTLNTGTKPCPGCVCR